MHLSRHRPETVSKKKSIFLLMENYFFLTYFLIGAGMTIRVPLHENRKNLGDDYFVFS
jgi:hypothetical protein